MSALIGNGLMITLSNSRRAVIWLFCPPSGCFQTLVLTLDQLSS